LAGHGFREISFPLIFDDFSFLYCRHEVEKIAKSIAFVAALLSTRVSNKQKLDCKGATTSRGINSDMKNRHQRLDSLSRESTAQTKYFAV